MSFNSQVTHCRRVGMLLLPEFNSMSAQAFIDPLRAANYVQGEALFEWDWLSLDGGNIRASNTLSIATSQAIENTVYDFVVVNASWAPERFQNPGLRRWLRFQDAHHATLVGLDTGAFVLAFSGLMRGHPAVVHYEHTESYSELFPGSPVLQQLFIADGNRITGCGGVASTDLALEMVRELHGYDLANAAAHYLIHDRLRPGDVDQLSKTHEPAGYHIPGLLRESMMLMERNLEEPLKISEISEHLGLSQRQLERLYRRYTGVTPNRYYLDTRLDRARGLITQTQLSLVEITSACGFSSTEVMARNYHRRFGITPGKDRVEGRIPFQFRSHPRFSGV